MFFFLINLVKIEGHVFRGFFFRALDATTNKSIGNFEEQENAKTYNECSAISHSVNNNKDSVVLHWQAPADQSGEVFFKYFDFFQLSHFGVI